MPAADPATVARGDGALRFSGALVRDAVPALWKQVGAHAAGVRSIDLTAVSRVDSAGVALLAELAARCGAEPALVGAPEGLAELRAAYRLGPSLAFSG
jgi:phospholipid transport system transporter-binding protein